MFKLRPFQVGSQKPPSLAGFCFPGRCGEALNYPLSNQESLDSLPPHTSYRQEKGFGVVGTPTPHTPRLLDWKAGMDLTEMLLSVTFLWLSGRFSPHWGEKDPAAMAAQCSDQKENGCMTGEDPRNSCPHTLVWETSSLLGQLPVRLLSFPVVRDINCAAGSWLWPSICFFLLRICKLGFPCGKRRAEVQRGRRTSPGSSPS